MAERLPQDADYVIIGGGSAGCVLAARLSEDPRAHVLLLEAGHAEPAVESIDPVMWLALIGGPPTTWGDVTTIQAATGIPTLLPRGKTLGGGSAINAMLFLRGNRAGYDAWATSGAKGWGFDDLLPYFKRTESIPGRDPELRGQDGPMRVVPADPLPEVQAAALAGALELGYRATRDIGSGLEEGFGAADLTILDGRRQSAVDAYLTPALSRPNLSVITDALVERVRIEDGRARGVQVVLGSERFSVGARREVVLSAGAIGSPQLLLLSGVGPAAHLRDVGVEVRHEIAGVGGNFHDHPMTGVVYGADRPVPPIRTNHVEVLGQIDSPYAQNGPDLHFFFPDFPLTLPGLNEVPANGFSLCTSVLTPHSRGSVRLAGPDTTTPPLVDPNYLADERDLDVMAAGLRIVQQIGASKAFADWRPEPVSPPALDDETALREYARANVLTYYHPVGSCAMGEGPDAVVDSSLRVHGIAGLRVVDASVMPSVTAGNPNATVYAIAERAAELIAAAY